MLDQFYGPRQIPPIRGSLFGPWLDAYVARLQERGNGRGSIRRYVHAVRHFGRWLQRRHVAAQAIDRRIVQEFLLTHLPRCRCAGPAAKEVVNVRPALMHLLRLPPFADHAALPSAPPSAIDSLLAEYDRFLRDVAGLAETTRCYRRRYVRTFVKEVAGRDATNWAKVRPQDVTGFFNGFVRQYRPGSIQVAASCIRSFLRFLRTTGRCDRDLTRAIPAVPQWSLASLPPVLSEAQIRVFLQQFERQTPRGRRDCAIALCLLELGLRVREVVALRLDDLDWRAGKLRLVGGKTRRDRELPLPQAIGEAITVYLQKGRPATASRHLFVRHRLFKGQAISDSVVHGVIGSALRKVPGYEQFKGSHVLRHTAATRLFQRGVPLKIVADVLGHQSIDTTALYTKVDVPTLATIALPWSEVQS